VTVADFARRALNAVVWRPDQADPESKMDLARAPLNFALITSTVLQLMNLDVPKFEAAMNSPLIILPAGHTASQAILSALLTALDAKALTTPDVLPPWPTLVKQTDVTAYVAGDGKVSLPQSIGASILANWVALQAEAGAKWKLKAQSTSGWFKAFPDFDGKP